VEVVDDGAVVEVVFDAVEAIVVDGVGGWVVILVVVAVVVELLHEVKTRDATNKRGSVIQITPLFIIVLFSFLECVLLRF
jgi:hypothetical protein